MGEDVTTMSSLGDTVGTSEIEDNAVTGAKIAMGSDAQGDILYYNGTDYVRLGAGTSGQFLKTQGAGANPTWATVSQGKLELIEHATVSGDTTFSSISGYKYYLVNWIIDTGTSGDALHVQLNGETANYSYRYVTGAHAITSASAQASIEICDNIYAVGQGSFMVAGESNGTGGGSVEFIGLSCSPPICPINEEFCLYGYAQVSSHETLDTVKLLKAGTGPLAGFATLWGYAET